MIAENTTFIRRLSLLVGILSTFLLSRGMAQSEAEKLLKTHSAKPDSYAGQSSMNGYTLKEFGDFYDRWKLVTVRYREDTKEMRFTYANELAAKSLAKKVKDFPDGAVFAKIGFISEEDPAFKSSVVPSGAKRYQFMVRDKKKFAATDGWGYVLLNGDGKTFNGDPKLNSMACAACHRLVPDRGYVFSEQASFSPFVEKLQRQTREDGVDLSRQQLKFKTTTKEKLEPRLQRQIPSKFTEVRSLQGSLQEHIFEGTVNEIGPFLADESFRTGIPAVLVGSSGDLFAYAYVADEMKDCAGGEKKVVVGRTITPVGKPSNKSDEIILKVLSYCGKYKNI